MEELRGGKVRAESLGAWKKVKLREVLHERKTYSQKGEGYPHVTLSTKGISPKTERYDRDHLVKDEEKAYKITHKGDICYNPANLKFGVICENTFGDAIFSPIYVTFEVKEGVCREFLANYLMRWDFINAVRKYEEGTVYERMAVKPEDFLRYEIFLPPIEEQRKIAAILTAQDKVIELKERLLAEKQRQKAYLMQQLLTGKKRLPGVGEEWKIKPLKKVTEKQTKKNNGFQYRLVLSNSAQHGIVSQDQEFDKEIANEERIDGYYVVIPGAFVYNPRISVTAPCGPINVNETGETGVMSPLYTVFTISSPQISQDFLKYYFQSSCWYKYVKGVANYGARHDRINISDDDFFDMPIPLPTKEEQNYVARVLSTADREIELLQQDIGQEKQKKKALMHLLLTGIVRVDESY